MKIVNGGERKTKQTKLEILGLFGKQQIPWTQTSFFGLQSLGRNFLLLSSCLCEVHFSWLADGLNVISFSVFALFHDQIYALVSGGKKRIYFLSFWSQTLSSSCIPLAIRDRFFPAKSDFTATFKN